MMFGKIVFSAALLLAGHAGTVQAQELRVISQGEQFQVFYPEGHTGNIMGGGEVRVSGHGENLRITHLDESFARDPAGIPVFVGGSEGRIAYLPFEGGRQRLAYR